MNAIHYATMAINTPDIHFSTRINIFLCVILIWLMGVGLRLTILAPAPVISLIHADLNMSETQIGLLSGIPAALFAGAAVLGALLIARLGALTTIMLGLIITAIGSALRGTVSNVALLYCATICTGLGVAVMQPSMPSLVRTWFPNNVRLATAIYINGLLVGEVIPVALTKQLMPLFSGSWRIDFIFWGGVCAIIALVVLMLAPKQRLSIPNTRSSLKWWPNWNTKLIWQLGIMLGSMNAMYFSANFFIPRYLDVLGSGTDVSIVLTALNVGQIPASILLLFLGNGLERRAWPYISCGLLCFISILCIVFTNTTVLITSGAFLLGFSTATVLILMLSLPPLLSPPEDVHRTAAAMLTIGYSCAIIIPIFSGLAWDITGIPLVVFFPLVLCAFALVMLAAKVCILDDSLKDKKSFSKFINAYADTK